MLCSAFNDAFFTYHSALVPQQSPEQNQIFFFKTAAAQPITAEEIELFTADKQMICSIELQTLKGLSFKECTLYSVPSSCRQFSLCFSLFVSLRFERRSLFVSLFIILL